MSETSQDQTQAKIQISWSVWGYSVLGCDLAKEAGSSQLNTFIWASVELITFL